MNVSSRHSISLVALAVGLLLLVAAVWQMDFASVRDHASGLALALPPVLLVSGLWHVARTIAWAACFPAPSRVPFWRLARIRLAAEAFSYLTIAGIAGEPLKVVMLDREIELREAAAAVALERLTFIIFTIVLVGGASIAAVAILPLSHTWVHVFRAFAVAAGIMLALAVAVLLDRGTYLGRVLRSHAEGGGSLARAFRFVIDVEGQLLDFVRARPGRLAVIFAMTAVCYAAMVAEAWVILRASGGAVTLVGAAAVETFTRVASFASAIVPANVGVLEASSVAATAAVGVTSAGAALAIGRRVRGLFWAAVGLAVYPRRSGGRDGHSDDETLIYAAPPDAPDDLLFGRVAGLPIAERVFRAAVRAGYSRVWIWAPGHADRLSTIARRVHLLPVQTPRSAAAFTAVGAGTLVAPEILRRALSITPSAGIVDVAAGPQYAVSGVVRVPGSSVDTISHGGPESTEVFAQGSPRLPDLRVNLSGPPSPSPLEDLLTARRLSSEPQPTPDDVIGGTASLAIRIASPDELPAADRAIRASVFKATDRNVARWNRTMSLPISVALLRTPLTANALSIGLLLLGLYAGWLFSRGSYLTGLAAAAISLAASILDGCDGEIARLKYQESRFGCWLETVADYTYYFAIFIGMTIGVARQTGRPIFYWIGAGALAGMAMTFLLLLYLRHRITGDRPERFAETAKARFISGGERWTGAFETLASVATRAQMPYGIFVFALVDALPLILVLCLVGSNLFWISTALRLRTIVGGATPRAGLPSRAAS